VESTNCDFGVSPGTVVQDDFRFWARADYLAYWVKHAPLPLSVVTGDPMNPSQELLNSDRNLGMFSGFRLTLGIWLDPYNSVGVEVSSFALQRRTSTFSASSDAAGNPTLAFPFTNVTPGAFGDALLPIAVPGIFAGNVTVASRLQLWGSEANADFLLLPRVEGFQVVGLVGFRYLDLEETLNIGTTSAALLTMPATVLTQLDQFNTRNQFYGGQLGTRFNWQGDRFGIDVTGKVALGAARQTINVEGASSQTGPGGPNGAFPGGFYAQPSNMGQSAVNRFAVIPSIELKLYMMLCPNLHAFVGYDFLYWNQVVRPGSQLDHNINLSQSSVLGNGALLGPALPTTPFNRTDFWAQGVTVGFELRF
jgi:hypothetical protein